MYEPCIGIDLGTTNTCVSLWNFDNMSYEVLINASGKSITPSWIAYGETGEEITVGELARYKSNLCYDVKRVIGKTFPEISKDKSLQRMLPFTL